MENDPNFKDANNYESIAKALGIELFGHYSAPQVIKKLNIPRNTLEALKNTGQIGYVKISERGRHRFWGWQLCEFLVRQTVCPGENQGKDTKLESGFLRNEKGGIHGTDAGITKEHIRQNEYHSALAIFKKQSDD
ncbi:hypothetical protein H0A36_27745 [Endozoicomonas sp. SM1973]|uniref:Uncharacterized protein n=1 Tax=Spartinivicinus marinus TaxID=2994442 RepID=A0A853IA66_9GAMM|nr:hypothetical protein [Spartinivicinus marinus]MCX4026992.1 hypothetical protein [Spartinivicinus marinus]NYZ69809.1 hypothetical protein [Spartinivicinus marinus]